MPKLLKNLYNKLYIDTLCTHLQTQYSAFNTELFINDIFNDLWLDLELKERMRHITYTLHKHLPQEYTLAIIILKKTFSKMNYSFSLENIIFQDYVEVYGLENLQISLSALEHFTVHSSSEFAIRQFIIKYPVESMDMMKTWTQSTNEHIRRLASEGCRPRLPWAIALKCFQENPKEVIEILELLKDDKSKYVQKSVANNLNDISKEHPHLTYEISRRWMNENPNTKAMLKHACRTLLKSGDTKTLELFGFSKPKEIDFIDFRITPDVALGEELEFSFTLSSQKSLGKLRLEFAIDFLRKNEKYNKKVFKIAEGNFSENEKQFSKIYSFKPISTRVYYKGVHTLYILINGVIYDQKSFTLY